MACETFCLDTDETFSNATLHSESLTIDTVRLVPVNEYTPLDVQLGKYHNKTTVIGKTKVKPRNLNRSETASRSTILVEIIANNVSYQPGDHVGIFPANRKEIVDGILNKLSGVENPDEILQLQLLKENHTTNGLCTKIKNYSHFIQMIKKKLFFNAGLTKSWEPHEKLPACSLRTLLTRFLDITTPPTRQLLTLLATFCEDKDDEERLNMLANVNTHPNIQTSLRNK